MTKRAFHNDEPTDIDSLNRDQFAAAFAKIAETCETPMVIGLYGTWGMGKTSLMKLIEKKLNEEQTRPVWFDAWQHQFDENPALALLHTTVNQFDMMQKEEVKKLLIVIAGAFGSMLLKATTNLKMKDINQLGERYKEEQFLIGEKRVRLHNHIKKIIEKAQGTPRRRIVFFIDDLDRCMPSKLLSLLESLKLYLNLPGCVYFLGADRLALEQSIKHNYKDLELSGTSYLDKIIQLPFTIPPISSDSMEVFINEYLSEELKPCLSLLEKGLGDNPRQVKRFINTLNLNHQLALGVNISGYNPNVLALLLLIQLRSYELFRMIVNQPTILKKLKQTGEKTKALRDEYLEKDNRLKEALDLVDLPSEKLLAQYIYFTQIARVTEDKTEPKFELDLESILSDHVKWISSKVKKGKAANLSYANLKGANLMDANLMEANLMEANLSRANLMGASLKGTDLMDANLMGASFKGADLMGANLNDAHLIAANLSRANLMGASLKGANLMDASLKGADLMDANLMDANLMDANLMEANLKGASLKGANLMDANLELAKNITIKQLSVVKTLFGALLDIKQVKKIEKQYPHLLEKPKEDKERKKKD